MRICPKPIPWSDVFQRLTIYARTRLVYSAVSAGATDLSRLGIQ